MFLWLRRIGFVFLSDPLALAGGVFFGGWWVVGGGWGWVVGGGGWLVGGFVV